MLIKAKALSDAAWKDVFSKNKGIKDNGLLRTLGEIKKTPEHEHDEAGRLLDEVLKLAGQLKKEKAVAAVPAVAKYIVEVISAAETLQRDVAKAKVYAAKDATPKAKQDEEEAEDSTDELLTVKLLALLKLAMKGAPMHALIASTGKEVAVMLSRKPIPPSRRTLLADRLDASGGVKCFAGQCVLDPDTKVTTFVLQADVAGMAKKLKRALLAQTGLRVNKVSCRGPDGAADHDSDEGFGPGAPVVDAFRPLDQSAPQGAPAVPAIDPDAAAAYERLPKAAKQIVNDTTDQIFYDQGHLPRDTKIASKSDPKADIWRAIRDGVMTGLGTEPKDLPPGVTPLVDLGDVDTGQEHSEKIDAFQAKELKLTPEQIGALTLYADNTALGDGGAAGGGGQALLNALQGGKLTPAMEVALTERFALAWMYAPTDNTSGAIENLDTLVKQIRALGGNGDMLAKRVARALFHVSTSVPGDAHTGSDYARLDRQRSVQAALRDRAIDLDPVGTTTAFGNGEATAAMLLGQIEWHWIPGSRFTGNPDRYGGKAPKPNEERSNAVINAVAKGALKPEEAQKFFDRIFSSSSDFDVSPVDSIFGSVFDCDNSTKDQQATMSELLAHTVNRAHAGGDEKIAEVNRKNMAAIMASSGGRAMLFTTSMSNEERLWALDMMSMTAGQPDKKPWTADQLAQGWESDVVGQAFGSKAVEAAKVAPTLTVRDPSDRGALSNVVGETFGLKQKDLSKETDADRKTRQEQGFGGSVYEESGALKQILDKVGTGATISTIPITAMNREHGSFLFKLLRVEKEGAKPYFLNEKGDVFSDQKQWWDKSDLPPGKLTFPKDLDLANPLVSVASKNSETWERFKDKADQAVKVAGMAAGALLVLGTGGAAAPLVAGLAAGYSAVQGVNSLLNKRDLGHDITDLGDSEIRGLYFEVVTDTLSVATMGATKLVGSLAKNGAKVSRAGAALIAGMTWTGNVADAAQLADKINSLSDRWGSLSDGAKDRELISLGFALGMKGITTAKGGKLKDQFSYTRLRNQIEYGTPVSVEQAKPGDLPEDMTIGVVHRDNKVIGIRYKGKADPEMIKLHADVATAMEASFELTNRIKRQLGLKEGQEPPPGSAAWEAFHELKKIDAELAMNDIAMGGANASKREELTIRQIELNAAVLREQARLEHWDKVGKGAVGAAQKGQEAAENLKIAEIATARKLTTPDGEGYRWVASKDGGDPYLYKPGKDRLYWEESSRQFMSEKDFAEYGEASRQIDKAFNKDFDMTRGPKEVRKKTPDETKNLGDRSDRNRKKYPEPPNPSDHGKTRRQFARELAKQLKITMDQLKALTRDFTGKALGKDWGKVWAQAVANSPKAAAALKEIRRLTYLADSQVAKKPDVASELYADAAALGKHAYNDVRKEFWNIVTSDPALVKRLKADYGLTVEPGVAPYLEFPDPMNPKSTLKLRLQLEHFDRKTDVPLRAQDPNNLLFSFGFENTQMLEAIRDIVTSRMGKPEPGDTNPML